MSIDFDEIDFDKIPLLYEPLTWKNIEQRLQEKYKKRSMKWIQKEAHELVNSLCHGAKKTLYVSKNETLKGKMEFYSMNYFLEMIVNNDNFRNDIKLLIETVEKKLARINHDKKENQEG